jgi:hypothetical protein
VDGGQRIIACVGDWESGPLVLFVDAATGNHLHGEDCAALEVFPADNGFIVKDEGWRGRHRGSPALFAFQRRGDRVKILRQAAPGGADLQLVGAGPTGDRLVIFHHGQTELWRWPELDLLDTWRWYAPGVDWAAGCVWGTLDDRELSLSALDRSWARSIPGRPFVGQVRSAGGGVLRASYRGARLFRPRGPSLSVLPPTSRVLWHISVSGGGRVVRVVLGGKPRRFVVDLDAPRVLEAPADAQILARSRYHLPAAPVWHPDPALDAVALVRRWPRTAVWHAGGFLCRLPDGSTPHAWLAGGTALLTSRREHDATLLELWGIPLPG